MSELYIKLRMSKPGLSMFTSMEAHQSIDDMKKKPTKNSKNSATDENDDEQKSPDKKSEYEIIFEELENSVLEFHSAAPQVLMFLRFSSDLQLHTELRRKLREEAKIIKERPRYEIYDISDDAQLFIRFINKKHIAFRQYVNKMPGYLITSLVSQYEVFLGQIIRSIIINKPHIIDESDKPIKFSDVSGYESIEELRCNIIDKTVDSVLRESHTQQIQWIEKSLNIKLTNDLEIWSEFVEICQRRNLLVHTGGIVSKQYISECTKFGIETDLEVGERLNTSRKYVIRATEVFYEFSYKMLQVLWRKLHAADSNAADNNLIDVTFDLIHNEEYELASSILQFSNKYIKNWNNERNKLICYINWANAIKLGGDPKRAKSIIKSKDWTSSSLEFQACAHAVCDEFNDLYKIMISLGSNGAIKKTDYLSWPVFIHAREVDEFHSTLEEIFGDVSELE